MKCEFTTLIHARGWTVRAACELWGIEYSNWRRKCRNVNPKKRKQIITMCDGLENKS